MDFADALAHVNQPRSEYQIRAWVLGQHPTPPQQFKQCVIELHAALRNLATADRERRKNLIKIERLEQTGDPIDAIDAEQLRDDLADIDRTMTGQRRELEVLQRIYDELPHFTAEQIETDQADYWDARLKNDVRAQIAAGGANWAHLQSMQQAGMLPEFVLEVRDAMRLAAERGVDVGDVLLGATLPDRVEAFVEPLALVGRNAA